MDEYLNMYTNTQLGYEIYSYMGLCELIKYKNLPNRIWEKICDVFEQDDEFRQSFELYAKTKTFSNKNNCFRSYLDFLITHKSKNGSRIIYPKVLAKNKDVIMHSIKYSSSILKYVPDTILKDRKFMLSLVKHNGNAIEFADPIIHEDFEIVLAAVEQTGSAMRYIDSNLRFNWELLPIALRKSYELFVPIVDYSLRKNKSFIIHILKQNIKVIWYINRKYRSDPEVMIEIVKDNLNNLKYVHPNLRLRLYESHHRSSWCRRSFQVSERT